MDGSGGIVATDPASQSIVVGAVTGFIAQRPHNDAGMIFVPQHHALPPFHESCCPLWIVCQFIVNGVAFDIGLIDNVKTVFVTKLVPTSIVGVVGGAHSIDVELLHQNDVGQHRLFGDGLAEPVIVVVAVDALKEHRFAIDEQLPALNLNLSKANPAALYFQNLVVWIFQRKHQGVEKRVFRGPFFRIGHGQTNLTISFDQLSDV